MDICEPYLPLSGSITAREAFWWLNSWDQTLQLLMPVVLLRPYQTLCVAQIFLVTALSDLFKEMSSFFIYL